MQSYYAPCNLDIIYLMFAPYRVVAVDSFLCAPQRALVVVNNYREHVSIAEMDLVDVDCVVIYLKYFGDGLFIPLGGSADWIKLIGGLYKIRVTNKILEAVKEVPPETLTEFLRNSIARREWVYEDLKNKGKYYSLFDSITKGKREFFECYFNMRQKLPYAPILSAILKFVRRTKIKDVSSNSIYMQKLIHKAAPLLREADSHLEVMLEGAEVANDTQWVELLIVGFYLRLCGYKGA